jgi:hypothetical protein
VSATLRSEAIYLVERLTDIAKGDSVKISATSDCIDEDSGVARVLVGKPPVVPTDRGLSAVYS